MKDDSMAKKTQGLRLSTSLTLPIEAVTEAFAIIGRRGSGKTSSAVVLTEEMIGAGVPVVVIDPTGAWWGLRSSANGKDDGLPVVIFGGEHADVPLDERAGALIAEAVVDGRFPAIIDLSHLSKSAMRRFIADFAETLYRHNREPLHLVIDEADLFVPQRLLNEGARTFGAIDDIVRRGRLKGLGVTLISQRPAVINKDVLSQVEVLVTLQLTSGLDVKAIDDWVRLNDIEDQAKVVKASLASLPTGTGWVWSPVLLAMLEQVTIRPRWTFDSSATPKPGQPRPVAEAFAAVDTDALGSRIAELAEAAADSDPRALKARIRSLEKALERAGATGATDRRPPPTPDPVVVEVAVLTREQEQLIGEATAQIQQKMNEVVEQTRAALDEMQHEIRTLVEALDGVKAPAEQASRPVPERRPARQTTTVRPASPPPSSAPRTPARAVSGSAHDSLPKAQGLILTALAQHGTLGINQIAIITGYRHTSGGFKNTLSQLRTNGWIDGAGTGTATITDAGLEALGDFDRLPEGDGLLEWWLNRGKPLGLAERTILEVLASAYPDHVSTEELAERTGYSATSGGFKNAMSKLRSLGLASGKGGLVLADELVG